MDVSNEVLMTLRQITRGIDLHSQKLIKKYGLTGPQLLVLKELSAKADLTPSELARKLSISQATITSMLDRLTQKGYIQRIRDQRDKRKVRIELQPKSLEVIKLNPSLLQEDFIDEFKSLQNWEQTQILSSLQRIVELMNLKNIKTSEYLSEAEMSHKGF